MGAAYLLKFDCYGTWLPGAPYGRSWARGTPYRLTMRAAQVVVESILDTASDRGWRLYAVHAVPEQVHMVLELDCAPARALGRIKAYASKRLSQQGFDADRDRRWARGGGFSRLPAEQAIQRAVQQVVAGLGPRMAVYVEKQTPARQTEEPLEAVALTMD
jgi:hypothetical protein